MTLPSREELVASLRAQRGSVKLEVECPVCKDNPIDVEVSCWHTFCLDCLESCLTTDNRCPLCRAELCERVAGDLQLIDLALQYPFVERLDLNFDVDDFLVDELMFERIVPRLAYDSELHVNGDKAVVSVDYGHLLPWAIAYMTLISDAARRQRNQEDIARHEWNLVANSVQTTLLLANGGEVESGELWDMLDKNIRRAACQQGISELRYAEEFDGASHFREDVFESLDGIVFEPRRFHVGHPVVATGYAVDWPAHVAPIEFPFEVDRLAVIRALEMLDGRSSGKLDPQGMTQPTLYISYRRLLPLMLAAIYVQKPLSLEGVNLTPAQDDYRHGAWTLAAWDLRDCLRDLHGQELSPDELEQTLIWSLGEIPSWEYGSKYQGTSTFGEDIERVVHTFIFWVFKVNKLQPPKPMKIQSPRPVQPNVPGYIQALISGGDSDEDEDDGAAEIAWNAWSGADGRSRFYLEEL